MCTARFDINTGIKEYTVEQINLHIKYGYKFESWEISNAFYVLFNGTLTNCNEKILASTMINKLENLLSTLEFNSIDFKKMIDKDDELAYIAAHTFLKACLNTAKKHPSTFLYIY
jgi:hypothetical protein